MVTVNITTSPTPVTVSLTSPAATPVVVAVSTAATPVSVSVSMAAAPAIVIAVALETAAVTVAHQEARDAYQLAVADGFVGTRAEWLASLQGEDGQTAEIVVLTLAAYLALSAETQMDGRWYVIPTTS